MTALGDILNNIEHEFRDKMFDFSTIYCLVDIGEAFGKAGDSDRAQTFRGAKAVVPLRSSLGRNTSDVNGAQFEGYRQLISGVIVSKKIADESGLFNSEYQPHKKMMLSVS